LEIRIDLALVEAKAPLSALADVTLLYPDGEIVIRRCTVFRKDREPAWANLPRLPIEKKGKRYFVSLIDLPGDLKRRVLEAVLSEYRRQTHAQ
jgi:hypothetical protein